MNGNRIKYYTGSFQSDQRNLMNLDRFNNASYPMHLEVQQVIMDIWTVIYGRGSFFRWLCV